MKTLSQHLKALNFGQFVNDKNEYCKVSTWYDKNTFKIQIVFQKENGGHNVYYVFVDFDDVS